MTFFQRNRQLNYYFFLSYLIILGICSNYLKTITFAGTETIIYTTAIYLSYSLIYLLPAIFLTMIINSLQCRLKKMLPAGYHGRYIRQPSSVSALP